MGSSVHSSFLQSILLLTRSCDGIGSNQQIKGGNPDGKKTNTKAECTKWCKDTPTCQMWLWHPHGMYAKSCRIHKQGWFVEGKQGDVVSGRCIEERSCDRTKKGQQIKGGNPDGKKTNTQAECSEWCRNTTTCQMWLWHPHGAFAKSCRIHGQGWFVEGQQPEFVSGSCGERSCDGITQGQQIKGGNPEGKRTNTQTE